ncbi:MAG: OmpA family protein [Cytophagales bacterium]|nr:OmpA family protein [Bernardetiaceae bacterium]MDW8211194.1 OmpA family protein [Cytophagales bacterium]
MRKNAFVIIILAGSTLSCTSTLKKAELKFARAEYETAAQLYKKVLESKPTNGAEINFLIGECYRLSNRLRQSLPYYQAAVNGGYGNDTLSFYLGMSLKYNQMYSDAKAALEKYVKMGRNPELVRRAKLEVQNLAQVEQILKMETFTTISNCEAINTPAAEYGPTFYQGNLIFASSRRGEKIFETTGGGFTDFYEFAFSDTLTCAGQVRPFLGAEFNLDGHNEGGIAFDPNHRFMIFARGNSGQKKEPFREVNLFISRFIDGLWSPPEFLDRVSDSLTWDSTPALSLDGKTLYFASNRKDNSQGGIDIYFSRLNDNGTWTRPRNLGKVVNTPGDEMFPYIAPDGRLFFASNGHAGLGGLDIFVQDTVIVGYDSLKRPIKQLQIKNVGTPINSPYDDFGIVFRSKNSGYFTSNRVGDNAKGDDDIFMFQNDSADMKTVAYYLRGTVYGKNDLNASPAILPQTLVILKDGQGNLIDSIRTDDQGKYAFEKPIEIDQIYQITGQKPEYLSDNEQLDTHGKGVNPKTLPLRHNKIYFDVDLMLRRDILISQREQKNPKRPLKPSDVPEIEILYEYDSARITPQAAAILDEFVEFLKDYFEQYPNTVLELGSHTDSRGSDAYNMRLSQRRAASAVEYIVSKGIPRQNIVAKGYGETEPKIPRAKTEAEHQANRRTTIKIVKP